MPIYLYGKCSQPCRALVLALLATERDSTRLAEYNLQVICYYGAVYLGLVAVTCCMCLHPKS